MVLETLALSVFNHDCAIASAAARMVTAAGQRPIIEMGSRRTHERAAVAAARAAYLSGFATTSNLRAGYEYGVPTAGTSAHAFTMVHDNERHAFEVQVGAVGAGTTLLVDTYDVARAVRTAVQVAGTGLGAVRIDSGDFAEVTRAVRRQLDELGAAKTRIVVTGDLDEHAIAALAPAPADGYGVGTALVTGSGVPTASLVYKLVARQGASGQLEPVAKRSVGKPTIGGRKWAVRTLDPAGHGRGRGGQHHPAIPRRRGAGARAGAPGAAAGAGQGRADRGPRAAGGRAGPPPPRAGRAAAPGSAALPRRAGHSHPDRPGVAGEIGSARMLAGR